jgi:hypothetical protein
MRKAETRRRLHLDWFAGRTRDDAERAIERALHALEQGGKPTEDQLADLADAVDAYREGTHWVAVALAGAVLGNHRPLEIARRPVAPGASPADIRADYDAARRGVASFE